MVSRMDARWGETLSDHRSVLRSAFLAHDGFEMGTEGDSFFVVVSSRTTHHFGLVTPGT